MSDYIMSDSVAGITKYTLHEKHKSNFLPVATYESSVLTFPNKGRLSNYGTIEGSNEYYYTDFIPVKLLSNDESGVCMKNIYANATDDIVMCSYTDTSFSTGLGAITINELGCGTSGGGATLDQINYRIAANANYVVFCSSSTTTTVNTTDKACFNLIDIPVIKSCDNQGYMYEGDIVSDTGDWSYSDFIPLSDLVTGPEGRCVYIETPSNAANVKFELFDESYNYLGSVIYEDLGASLTATDIIDYANACEGAYYVVFNWDNLTLEEDYLNAIYVSGRCYEQSRTFSVTSQSASGNESDFSNEVTHNGNTHAYSYSYVTPTCQNMGYTKCTCVRCGDVWTHTQRPALVHKWGEVTYEWSGESYRYGGDNLYTCTATRTCSGNGTSSHTDTLSATVTYNVTTAPTTTTNGLQTVTATFSEAWASSQVRSDLNMFSELKSPTGRVGFSSTDENNNKIYSIEVTNPNESSTGDENEAHVCYIVLYDSDGVVVASTSLVVQVDSTQDTTIKVSSSITAYSYTMKLSGAGVYKSDSKAYSDRVG